MDAIELLTTRQSDSNLSFPGPSQAQLEIIKKAALKVPDHGSLKPWRFILVEGDDRDKLGDIYYQAAVEEQQEERIINRARALPQRAPMLIIAICPFQEHPKVPRIEQIESAACSVFAMQQAAFAQHLSGVWRTGYFAQSPKVKALLGMKAEDEIVGYLYLGTPTVTCTKPIRSTPEQFFESL
ncbi:NAD(P)H nitroreductase [Pseudoalteromonas aurantia]|uniref:Putative NAD(P)H nitroreductase n=1 Tax=Pseudoalteromonas aurantia 208 TaxID=1314867 RepID=A0ABR9EBS2_9GAMM|nr:NAD(P)H nitroreductase [Pseudoalteromonas aurantia]MBE0368192.1 hypothetical protein [Pseudoalteromonas aurantia 208]